MKGLDRSFDRDVEPKPGSLRLRLTRRRCGRSSEAPRLVFERLERDSSDTALRVDVA